MTIARTSGALVRGVGAALQVWPPSSDFQIVPTAPAKIRFGEAGSIVIEWIVSSSGSEDGGPMLVQRLTSPDADPARLQRKSNPASDRKDLLMRAFVPILDLDRAREA